MLALAELTGRSPASISRRLGNFEGTAHPGRGLKPVTGEPLSTFRAMAADGALRQRMVHEVVARLIAGRSLPVGPAAPPEARLVLPEESIAESVEVPTEAGARQLVRAEAALVGRYRDWFDPTGARLRAWTIPVGGDTLRTDLYDTRLHLLIEAKGAVSRYLLRQAVGQLIDYGRYLAPLPRLAVLLPSEPNRDLAALPAEVGIGIIWASRDGFEDSAAGELTARS